MKLFSVVARNFLVVPALSLLLSSVSCAATQPFPRALPEGKFPEDDRLVNLRRLDRSQFPLQIPPTPAQWRERAAKLRRQVLVSQGLWPMPQKTPLNAVVYGRTEHGDYTVEKVYFESFPGSFVTGSLYRPLGVGESARNAAGKRPAVLSMHGHWAGARFHDLGEEGIREEIKSGAEIFERGGRFFHQARAVQLARMGCVVFAYDMVGFNDSYPQFPDHSPGIREAMNTRENWGFYSPMAQLHLQNIMGWQTYNSIRALDFVQSLADVDPTRIGATGESGGATQVLMLGAVDDRLTAMLPAVNVSAGTQGGCVCENAPYLRIGAGGLDFAALAAPRPLGLTAADDWTRELETKGYPELKQLYAMLDHKEDLAAVFHLQFPHNFNHVNRLFLYAFMNRHLRLGQKEPIEERDYVPQTNKEATVWDAAAGHPAPSGDKDEFERKLLRGWKDDSQKQLNALIPGKNDKKAWQEYRRVVGGAWEVMLGRTLDEVGKVEWKTTQREPRAEYSVESGLLTHATKEGKTEQLPVLQIHPPKSNGQTVIWISDSGKAALFTQDGVPISAVSRLLEAGFTVLGLDLLGQGEFTADGKPVETQRTWLHLGNEPRPWYGFPSYVYGYNSPLFAKRTHDILTAIRFLQTSEPAPQRIHLVGLGKTAGPVAAAARSQAGEAISKTAIEYSGFRFTDINSYNDPMFMPGAGKYHDISGLLGLIAPHPLRVFGDEATLPAITDALYQAADAKPQLTLGGKAEPDTLVKWLMGP